MITSYEQEMFSFFTGDETRFTQLLKIAEHLPMVKRQLQEAFWDHVVIALKDKCSSLEEKWSAKRLGPVSSGISKVMLFKDKWGMTSDGCAQLAVSAEHLSTEPFYGPFIHNKVNSLNLDATLSYLRGLDIAKLYHDDKTTWYPFFAYFELQMTANDDFIELLPDRRQGLVDKIAGQQWDMAMNLAPHLDHIHEHCRQSR